MRLAIVRQRYNPYGGAERFIERALAALGREGVAATVFARSWSGDAAQVVRCDPFHIGRTWRDWSFARAVCSALSHHDVDLVQSHERIACCDIYRAGDGVHAQWLANRGAALGLFGRFAAAINPYHRYVLAAERYLFASPRLRAVICNSHMVKKEIRRHFGVAEEKLHVIYNGVDIESFHPRLRELHREATRRQLGIPPQATAHLFVGSGFERKGVFRLLDAFARSSRANRNDAHLIVVGADKALARAEKLSRSLVIADRVHFAGGQKDVRPWYGAADTFVLPTLYDPFPNAALEAMACGLPVVTTTQCGAAELIEPGKNGFVCDALDVPALAQRLGEFNVERAAEMGRAARSAVAQLDLDSMAAKLAGLYRTLLRTPEHV